MGNNNEKELQKIFTANLNRYIDISGKQQIEIANTLNIRPTTLNNWCTGKAIPRMGSIQMLADYFKVNKSDLLDDYDETKKNNDILSDIVIRAQRNEKFLDLMKSLHSIPDDRLDMAKAVIDALGK